MKLGGNLSASKALGVRVGATPVSTGKYDSRSAAEYKRKLAERVREDQFCFPSDILSQLNQGVVVDQSVSNEQEAPIQEKKEAKKEFETPSSITAGPSRFSRLGAVKTDKSLDMNVLKEELPTVSSFPSSSNTLSASENPKLSSQTIKKSNISELAKSKDSVGSERLGMGFRKLNQQPVNTATQDRPNNDTKSVSSDQYFKVTDNEDSANKERIRNFEGAKSVSSNQFFNKNNTSGNSWEDEASNSGKY